MLAQPVTLNWCATPQGPEHRLTAVERCMLVQLVGTGSLTPLLQSLWCSASQLGRAAFLAVLRPALARPHRSAPVQVTLWPSSHDGLAAPPSGVSLTIQCLVALLALLLCVQCYLVYMRGTQCLCQAHPVTPGHAHGSCGWCSSLRVGASPDLRWWASPANSAMWEAFYSKGRMLAGVPVWHPCQQGPTLPTILLGHSCQGADS